MSPLCRSNYSRSGVRKKQQAGSSKLLENIAGICPKLGHRKFKVFVVAVKMWFESKWIDADPLSPSTSELAKGENRT